MKLRPGISWNDLRKAEDSSFFDPELLARKHVYTGKGFTTQAGSHQIGGIALKHHLKHGSFSMLTAHNPGAKMLSPQENKKRNAALEHDLRSAGAIYHKVHGQYGGNREESFMVHHTENMAPGTLSELAAKHGQESILHSSMGKHQLLHVTGEHMGKHYKGQGHKVTPKAKDNYSAPVDAPKKKFSMDLNFDQMHKSEKAHKLPRVPESFLISDEDGQHHEVSFDIDFNKIHD